MQTKSPIEEQEPIYNYCTHSSYTGKLDNEGKMTGIGTYHFPDGTEYQGHFKLGLFHGRGMIVHPSKFKMCGNFVNGKCEQYEMFFNDGLQYKETDWKYCTKSDRRFWVEVLHGISPIGETFLTKEKPARTIPRGFYDTEEGFFDTESEYVVNAETLKRKRYICPAEKKNILRHFRMNEIDFKEQEKLAASSRIHDISTDSWVSSDSE